MRLEKQIHVPNIINKTVNKLKTDGNYSTIKLTKQKK